MDKQLPSGLPAELSIGEVTARTGVPASALRFYEKKGLISSRRSAGNQRRYPREILRRVAIIKVAQRLGIPLAEILDVFATLPDDRTPTAEDWQCISAQWRQQLNQRITRLERLRDHLSDCIGCGCLSLDSCPLRNPQDELSAEAGQGAWLLEGP